MAASLVAGPALTTLSNSISTILDVLVRVIALGYVYFGWKLIFGPGGAKATGDASIENLPINEITENVISTSLLAVGESYKFTLDKKENHTLTVIEVGNNSAKINISSHPIELELRVNEEKEVDLNDDNINDLAVKLDEIKNGIFAKFSLRTLIEVEKPGEEAVEGETGKEGIISGEQIKEFTNKYYLAILIVILVAIFWILKKKSYKR